MLAAGLPTPAAPYPDKRATKFQRSLSNRNYHDREAASPDTPRRATPRSLTEVPEFVDMLGRSRRAHRLVRIDRQTVDRRNRPDEPVELLRLYLNAR
jgi:hypothetical protein